MAFGLPIVCYDRGGQTDFLNTPATGFVVPLNDLVAFNSAVASLRDSPQLRAAIARHNLAAVEEFFIERCAERYEQLFGDALARSARLAGPRVAV
jgi:glycosyltransferase involved in cell wall biosynthesis